MLYAREGFFMARTSKTPWFWEKRNGWYVQKDGKHVKLGEHPADAKPPKKSKTTGQWNPPDEIMKAFHKLMEQPKVVHTVTSTGPFVASILDEFYLWSITHRAADTAASYNKRLQSFLNYLKSR